MKEITPFSVTGKVIRGNQLGRKLGYPTANISIGNESDYHSLTGVYAVKIHLGDQILEGMANIGFRPTLDEPSFTIEVHCFDYEETIYGETITIEFLKHIREEKHFATLDALKKKMQEDEKMARQLLHNPDSDPQ